MAERLASAVSSGDFAVSSSVFGFSASRRLPGVRGRVDLGGRPPRPPTDPDVHVKCTRLFTS